MSRSSSVTTFMPLDIWREILVRVPVESLIRGRAVCKGWRAVIDDPCFVRAHTNKRQQLSSTSPTIIIQEAVGPRYSAAVSCYSLDLEALIICCSSSKGRQAVAAKPLDLPAGKSLLPFVSECNGLCLTNKYPAALTIWNPLTHERLELPRNGNFSKNESSAFGLGYDGTTDDYKAVVILRNRHTHVYSLKLDTWRRIMDCPCDARVGPGVFVCGGLNWLSGGEKEVVALDLGTEKYSPLQMPRLRNTIMTTWTNYKVMLLNVLGGLALCDYGFESHLDVWVMKQLGSWTKLFSIDWKPNISTWGFFLRPVAFIMKKKKEEEEEEDKLLVFLADTRDGFFLFDVETKSFNSVEIDDGSIIRKDDSVLYSKQMLVGTLFRLHANCSNKKRMEMKSVFCLGDAKPKCFVL